MCNAIVATVTASAYCIHTSVLVYCINAISTHELLLLIMVDEILVYMIMRLSSASKLTRDIRLHRLR